MVARSYACTLMPRVVRDRAECAILGGQGTVPQGTIHCTGWPVICAISS